MKARDLAGGFLTVVVFTLGLYIGARYGNVYGWRP